MENINILKRNMNKRLTAKLVPERWDYLELSQFAQLYKVKVDPSHAPSNYKCLELEHFDEGTGRINGFTQIRSQKSIKNKFEVGHVLFGKLRPYLRKFWLATFSGVCSSEVWVLNAIEKKCDNAFLFYLVQNSRFIQSANVSTGTKMPRADWGYVSEFPFPVPPLAEQKKIALVLSTWDRAIEKTEQLIAQKQRLKKGLMQQLLTGKVRFREFVKSKKMKKTKLGLIPEDWTLVDINHVTLDHKQGYYTTDPYTKHGRYLLLRGTDMLNPTIDLSTTPRIDASRNDYELFKVEVGDILIVRSGGIGRYGIVTETLLGIFGSYLIRFRLDNKLILNEFFGLFYQSFISMNQLKSITQGSSNININAENIKSLKVPLPAIEEQKSILMLLLSLEKKITMNNTLLLNLKRQKRGLMQQLLTGKVRVKH